MKAVFDSDVLIDYLQGVDQARREIQRYKSPLYSIISWMEVMCGAVDEPERQAAETLFSSMNGVDISMDIALRAVHERKSLHLKLPDAIVLATANCEGCILVTRNSKDFARSDPRVRILYSI